jgi:uncharacterized membrane protein YqjE
VVETEDNKPREKWYLKTRTVVLALLIFGPLALPLLWVHPRYRLVVKLTWTVVFVVLTIITWQATVSSVKSINKYYSEIFN